MVIEKIETKEVAPVKRKLRNKDLTAGQEAIIEYAIKVAENKEAFKLADDLNKFLEGN